MSQPQEQPQQQPVTQQPQQRQQQPKKDKKGGGNKGPVELTPPPKYLSERLELWDKLKAAADAELASKERKPITVTLPDGKTVEGTSYETTPMEIVKGIASSLADRTVISKVSLTSNTW